MHAWVLIFKKNEVTEEFDELQIISITRYKQQSMQYLQQQQ